MSVTIKIYGMKCGGCENSLNKKFQEAFPSAKLSTHHPALDAKLKPDPAVPIESQLGFIRSLGYKIEVGPSKGIQTDLIDLALSFICAMNVMIFALVEYLAGPGELPNSFIQFFRMCSFILATASLSYAARSILRKMFASIKNLSPSVDMSIGIALGIAYAFSVYSLFDTSIEPFFDSITATIFFLLLGRFFQNRFLRETAKKTAELFKPTEFPVTLVNGHKSEEITLNEVKKGDVFKVAPGEVVPIAATLVQKKARGSLDLINGEADIKTMSEGDTIQAGTVCLQTPMLLKSTSDGSESELKINQEQAFRQTLYKMNLSTLSDKLAGVFSLIVLLSATLSFLLNTEVEVAENISRSVAILLIACPCAFAIALPLATLRCAFTASKVGIYFKNANAIQRLSAVTRIGFDKTGTLSKKDLFITKSEWVLPVSNAEKDALYLASKESNHASSQAFANSLQIEAPKAEGYLMKEVHGSGIYIEWANNVFKLGKKSFVCPDEETQSFDLFLSKNNKVIARFNVREESARGIKACINHLRAMNLTSYLISGDQASKVTTFAKRYGIDHAYGETSSDEKRKILDSFQEPCVMVGNGFNDILAISKSHVGISVAGSTSAAYDFSDVHLVHEDIDLIPYAIKL